MPRAARTAALSTIVLALLLLAATAAAQAPGPRVELRPEGNSLNVDMTVPAANLWLCESGSCAGRGEGELRVLVRASNVAPGLGAYAFVARYDPDVVRSVHPCDMVFGPAGAGAARGPVDEADTSGINPLCADDAGAAAPATCALSYVLEDVVHFGCVSSGQAAGPTGNFNLAAMMLVPHPDLRRDLYPGTGNGIFSVVELRGCQLADTLGHAIGDGAPMPCGDLGVTVRILEADLDLDCDVDAADMQAIASRYGSSVGDALYDRWYDLEPDAPDLDIDIRDLQKVFGRQGSLCQVAMPAQPPLRPVVPFGN